MTTVKLDYPELLAIQVAIKYLVDDSSLMLAIISNSEHPLFTARDKIEEAIKKEKET